MPCLSVLALLLGCSGSAPAPYKGPPPEYEAPRPGPGGSAPAASKLPDDEPELPPYGSVEDLGASIDAYVKGYGAGYGEAYRPSGVLLVTHEGRTIVTRAYGRTSRPDGPAPTAGTRFRVGSITKPIVATLVLRLVEDKTLTLTDSVRKWVPELPASYEPVTIHRLLSQTSGVASYTDPGGLLDRKTEDVPQADVLAWLAARAPDAADPAAPPRFSYSNSNFYLLGVVVERATKTTLSEALQKKIFSVAAMRSAGAAAATGDAVGYHRSPRDQIEPATVVSNALPFGAGFLRASAEDLAAFERSLAGTALLSDASRTKLWTPTTKDYGYGWVIGDIGGSKVQWHNGAIDGFQGFLGRAPQEQVAVVYLGNVFEFEATRLGLDVLKMAMTGSSVPPPVEREATPIDDALGQRVAGDYVLDKTARKELAKQLPPELISSIEGMTLTYEAGALTAKPSGQGELGLKRAADGTLFHPTLRLEIVLDAGPSKPGQAPAAKVPGFTLRQGGVVAKYLRGALPKPKPAKPPKKK